MLNEATSDQFIVISKNKAIFFCTLRKSPQVVKWTNTGYFQITLIKWLGWFDKGWFHHRKVACRLNPCLLCSYLIALMQASRNFHVQNSNRRIQFKSKLRVCSQILGLKVAHCCVCQECLRRANVTVTKSVTNSFAQTFKLCKKAKNGRFPNFDATT
jgi:hypothetical protein